MPNLFRWSFLFLFCWLTLCGGSHAGIVYSNDFASPGRLSDFTVIGESFPNFNVPPLHQVSVENGQLKIDSQLFNPNGPGNPPFLTGSARLLVDPSLLAPSLNPVLSNNGGLVTWAFNVANSDGALNNGFEFILGATSVDVTNISTHGYVFSGGGRVGTSMAIRRFDFGTGGGGQDFLEVANGLGVLPQRGSIRITFEPSSARWSLFGQFGSAFVDPLSVTNLLGTAVDSRYVSVATPVVGFGGGGTGTDFFDNVSISVIPEPGGMLWAIGLCGVFVFRRFRNRL